MIFPAIRTVFSDDVSKINNLSPSWSHKLNVFLQPSNGIAKRQHQSEGNIYPQCSGTPRIQVYQILSMLVVKSKMNHEHFDVQVSKVSYRQTNQRVKSTILWRLPRHCRCRFRRNCVLEPDRQESHLGMVFGDDKLMVVGHLLNPVLSIDFVVSSFLFQDRI